MELPRYVVLRTRRYTTCLSYEKEAGWEHGFLKFVGETVVSPCVKFEVQRAKNNNEFVHIRCCYNNKYWAPRQRKEERMAMIVAGANEPQEDQKKESCTLFMPVRVDGHPNKVRFKHVQLGHYVRYVLKSTGPYARSLCAVADDPRYSDEYNFIFMDWESLLILPKHIAFKGDNGKYVGVRPINNQQHLQFYTDDVGDPGVGHTISYTRDGSICIRSGYSGKLWRRIPDWILADSADSNDADALFWPVKAANTVVALRNLGNKKFCRRLSSAGNMMNCLIADVPTIPREARLQVEELVLSRQIYNVDFHLTDARIYDRSFLTLTTGFATNMSTQPNTADIKLSYSQTESTTWKGSVSLKVGVKTTIVTGIPKIAKGKVEVSGEISGSFEYGKTTSKTNNVETVYRVTVPPMSSVTVGVMATMGSCDVPFSYRQRDTLTNGEQVTLNMDDGLFTGINSYNFKYEVKQQSL